MADEDLRRPASLRELLRRHERVIILQTVRANGGSRKVAAEVLGISYPTLLRRMRTLRITHQDVPLRSKNNLDSRSSRA